MTERFKRIAKMLEGCGFERSELNDFVKICLEKNNLRVYFGDKSMRVVSRNTFMIVPEDQLDTVSYSCRVLKVKFYNGFFIEYEDV